ncbi:ABC transporter [Streptomyces sp. NPDC006332]|uniref:ABC transporter n=1 Tax=Streptomyces sp. NPDC006332 TaxID=3155456 RepID=UPI0033BF7402
MPVAATVRVLLVPLARTMPWRTLGAAGAVGLLLAAVPRLLGDQPSDWLALNLLRVAALALAAGGAFLLDDPARHTTTPVPVRRPVRQLLRAAMMVPFTALLWTTAVLLVPAGVRPPVGAVTLEAATAFALALALSAASVRFREEPRPGAGVTAVLLTGAVLSWLLLPDRWALVVTVTDERWASAHQRWGVLLVAALLVWGVCGTEPLRRRRRRRRAAGSPEPARTTT